MGRCKGGSCYYCRQVDPILVGTGCCNRASTGCFKRASISLTNVTLPLFKMLALHFKQEIFRPEFSSPSLNGKLHKAKFFIQMPSSGCSKYPVILSGGVRTAHFQTQTKQILQRWVFTQVCEEWRMGIQLAHTQTHKYIHRHTGATPVQSFANSYYIVSCLDFISAVWTNTVIFSMKWTRCGSPGSGWGWTAKNRSFDRANYIAKLFGLCLGLWWPCNE